MVQVNAKIRCWDQVKKHALFGLSWRQLAQGYGARSFASGLALPRLANNTVNVAKGDPEKLKGKMCAYAFFVQMCREEHKKNPEVPVNFAEFSKKCSKRWKTMSRKEKSKLNEMAKADKVLYDREMKDYRRAKGGKKKDPKAPRRPLSGFLLFCSEFHPKIKSTKPGVSIRDVAKKLGEM